MPVYRSKARKTRLASLRAAALPYSSLVSRNGPLPSVRVKIRPIAPSAPVAHFTGYRELLLVNAAALSRFFSFLDASQTCEYVINRPLLATPEEKQNYGRRVTAGGIQRPSSTACFGQYSLKVRLNAPSGAGSQLRSLSTPGASCWIQRSNEPSALRSSGSRSPMA